MLVGLRRSLASSCDVHLERAGLFEPPCPAHVAARLLDLVEAAEREARAPARVVLGQPGPDVVGHLPLGVVAQLAVELLFEPASLPDMVRRGSFFSRVRTPAALRKRPLTRPQGPRFGREGWVEEPERCGFFGWTTGSTIVRVVDDVPPVALTRRFLALCDHYGSQQLAVKLVASGRNAGVPGLPETDDWPAWDAAPMRAAVEYLEHKRGVR